MLAPPVLYEAIRLTFEEMAFLDLSEGPPAQPAAPVEEGPVLFLEYSRPRRGAMSLFLPKEVKFQIAEAIYGEDWNLLSALQLDDSLLELLNVLAGRLLTEHFGPGSSYSMGLPTVLYDPPGDLPGFAMSEYQFHYDSWAVSLVWYEVAE